MYSRSWRLVFSYLLGIGFVLFIGWRWGATWQAKCIDLGFDSFRSQLLTMWLTLNIAAIGATLLTGCPMLVLSGVWFTYIGDFLLPLLLHLQRSQPSPGGGLLLITPWLLIQFIASSLSIGLLVTGVGVASGLMFRRITLIPLSEIVRQRWQHFPYLSPVYEPLISPWLRLGFGLLCLVAVFISGGIAPLLKYGMTASLYTTYLPATTGNMTNTTISGTLTHETFTSEALKGATRGFDVYLPQAYITQPTARFPVLYLLHGSPGQPVDWWQAAHIDRIVESLMTSGRMRPTILIAPDGNGSTYHFSEWANSVDMQQLMEDMLAHDLVAVIDGHYRTLAQPTERIIAGISMGGYGAMNVGLHHPDIFGTVISLGGYFHAEGPVFGTGSAFDTPHTFNSPALWLATPEGQQHAQSLTTVLGVGLADNHFGPEGLALQQQLQQIHAHITLLSDPGGHGWDVWARQMAQALPLVLPAQP